MFALTLLFWKKWIASVLNNWPSPELLQRTAAGPLAKHPQQPHRAGRLPLRWQRPAHGAVGEHKTAMWPPLQV